MLSLFGRGIVLVWPRLMVDVLLDHGCCSCLATVVVLVWPRLLFLFGHSCCSCLATVVVLVWPQHCPCLATVGQMSVAVVPVCGRSGFALPR